MTTHTDRIRQMAQEADELAARLLGLDCYERDRQDFSDARDAFFAALVAEDCARHVETEPYFLDAPGHVRSALFGLARTIRARYAIAKPPEAG